MKKILSTLHRWKKNARDVSLPQSLLPAIVAIVLALPSDEFSWGLAVLALFGVGSLHLGLNLWDDYFDFRHRDASHRDRLEHRGIRARIGKCDYLTSGQSTLSDLFTAAASFCLVALIAGSIIYYFRGMTIFWLIIVSAVVGLSYSASPLRLSYRGLGELTIGFMFGPLLMAGVYTAAGGQFSWELCWLSVPIGFLVANIVFTHAIMDYEPDREVGKKTLAVLLESKERMLFVSAIIQFLPYAILIIGVLFGHISPFYLLALLTFPMAIGLWKSLHCFTLNPMDNPSPRPWMGPMENWENISKAGIDWFMVRWLLARNLITFFALLLMIASFFA